MSKINSFDPQNDGIDHINIYSRGRTELGRFLSNFYHQKVSTPDGVFASIEGYWYWLGTDDGEKDGLKNLFGSEAKKIGKELKVKSKRFDENFVGKIKRAIFNKIMSNIPMAIELKKSTLPLVHYYNYKGKTVEPEDNLFVIEFINNLRVKLQSYENLIYQKKCLFTAPQGSFLGQSCNALGDWGAGIALQFKEKFPHSFLEQRKICSGQVLGQSFCTEEKGYKVVSLFTSRGYGKNKSSNEEILKNTRKSLIDFFSKDNRNHLYIPKINSGLFNVPWEMTEIVILSVILLNPKVKLIVCEK